MLVICVGEARLARVRRGRDVVERQQRFERVRHVVDVARADPLGVVLVGRLQERARAGGGVGELGVPDVELGERAVEVVDVAGDGVGVREREQRLHLPVGVLVRGAVPPIGVVCVGGETPSGCRPHHIPPGLPL